MSWEYRAGKLVTVDMHSLVFSPFLLSSFHSCYIFSVFVSEMDQEFPSSKSTNFQAKFLSGYFESFFLMLPWLISLVVLFFLPLVFPC